MEPRAVQSDTARHGIWGQSDAHNRRALKHKEMEGVQAGKARCRDCKQSKATTGSQRASTCTHSATRRYNRYRQPKMGTASRRDTGKYSGSRQPQVGIERCRGYRHSRGRRVTGSQRGGTGSVGGTSNQSVGYRQPKRKHMEIQEWK